MGANGTTSAILGFDGGENASKNKVAGRSQKSIAAVSIRAVPHWQRDRNNGSMSAIYGAGHPGAYGGVVYIAST